MPRPAVLDSSLLFTLGKAGRLDVLSKTASFEWHIGSIVRSELITSETRAPVERAIVDGRIRLAPLDSDSAEGMSLFAEWSERVDPGEAESIAIALANGWLVALEDRVAQRRIDREVGPGHWINCVNILLSAVRSHALTLVEADEAFAGLDVYSGYEKRGVRSLKDIAPNIE